MDKKCKNFSNEWLKTAHLQLSQKSFKTCLRKLTIIAPFIPWIIFYFNFFKIKKLQKKTKKRREKKIRIFYFFIFEISPKKVPRVTPSTLSTPLKYFWIGWSRRGHWKFILQMLARVHLFCSTQLTVEGWVFKSADFWIQESNDKIDTFLTIY